MNGFQQRLGCIAHPGRFANIQGERSQQTMKKSAEQAMARSMLAHCNKGYSVLYVLRRSAGRYTVLVGLLMLSVVALISADDCTVKGFCLWVGGMFLGALCRDIGWLRRIKMGWPFTQKITDWRKVEEIAEGKDTANGGLPDSPVQRLRRRRRLSAP